MLECVKPSRNRMLLSRFRDGHCRPWASARLSGPRAGPSGVPEIADEGQAQAEPALAVLSAMAHGRDADEDTLRKVGAKSDVYEPLKRMPVRGQVPSSIDELAAESTT
jgi:hypothetical protein